MSTFHLLHDDELDGDGKELNGVGDLQGSKPK